jgi:hypothetical protein
MAKTPWRCSQCGTVNEPGARACVSCGKWPSLFDLQDNVVEDAELEPEIARGEVFEPETFEPEVFRPEGEEWQDLPEETEAEPEQKGRLGRRLVSLIWVIGIVVWILVNALADR